MIRYGRARGFTLIEVVVAFAILALSLGALYEIFGGALRRSGVARQQELAALRAESLLSEFRGSRGLLPAAHSGHDEDLGLTWRISAKPYPSQISEQGLFQLESVDVEVGLSGGRNRVLLQSVELTRRNES